MYTKIPKTVNVPTDKPPAKIRWLGNTHDVIKSFPISVRYNLGTDLRRLQDGLRPLDSGPMPGVGTGVYELRDEDLDAWYRVIYLKQTKGKIYVLHCFTKQSNQTSRQDTNTARLRLVEANKELVEEGRDANRGTRHEWGCV